MNLSKSSWLVIIGAGLLIISFLLPWINVFGIGVNASQIAQYSQYSPQFSSLVYLLYLVPGAGILSLVVFFLSRKKAEAKNLSFVYILSALVSGGIAGYTFLQIKQGIAEVTKSTEGLGELGESFSFLGKSLGYGFGLWLALLGAVVLLIGGIMALSEQKPKIPTTPTTLES